MITYVFMYLLFLSVSWVKGMEIGQHIPENNIYQYSPHKKCFYELHPNGSFSRSDLNMSENSYKMYDATLLATSDGFFIQKKDKSNVSDSEPHSSPQLVFPIYATSKQKKHLFELLQHQQAQSDKFIFMIDNSHNYYRITQLEQTSQPYGHISSFSSTCSTSQSSHEEENIKDNTNDSKQEIELRLKDKSELASLSSSCIEKSRQLKQLCDIREQKQLQYMLAGAAAIIIGAALLYKYNSLSF